MFIDIVIKGETIKVNTNIITTYRAIEKKEKFHPMITFLPGKEVELDITGSPFDTEQACINAIESLLGGN